MPDRFQEETPEEAAMLALRRREMWAEPFFSDEQPCENCGHPVSKCACDDAPDEPVCPDLYPQLVAARNVREIHEVCIAHRLVCAGCAGRKQPGRATGETERKDRKAA